MKAISQPTTPAPTMRKRAGTASSAVSSSGVMTVFPSKGRPGRTMGREPVATMVRGAARTRAVPSGRRTSTSCGLLNAAVPVSVAMAFRRRSVARTPSSHIVVLWRLSRMAL